MANVQLNPMLESLRGKVGDLVFKKIYGSMIISRRPNMTNRILSDAQKAANERFREAARYGTMVMTNPQAKALYEQAARERNQPMFSLMIADFFHPPEVDEIDLSLYTRQAESVVGVRASDDVGVVGVDVSITNAAGDPIEHGSAVKSGTDMGLWLYTATASVPAGTQLRVEVTATDRPGHKGTKIANA